MDLVLVKTYGLSFTFHFMYFESVLFSLYKKKTASTKTASAAKYPTSQSQTLANIRYKEGFIKERKWRFIINRQIFLYCRDKITNDNFIYKRYFISILDLKKKTINQTLPYTVSYSHKYFFGVNDIWLEIESQMNCELKRILQIENVREAYTHTQTHVSVCVCLM